MIDTTQAQNAYDNGVSSFTKGMSDLVNSQNNTLDQTSASYDPQIKALQDQVAGFDSQIQNIKGTLNNLPANVTARGNGMGSDAQLSRQVTAESTPLQANLANLGLAETPIASALATTQTNKQAALSALNDKFARETTGYTTTAQATLNNLLDKLTSQRTLNAAEMQQTYDLAKQEQAYQQQLSLNAAQNGTYDNLMKFLGGGAGGNGTTGSAPLASYERSLAGSVAYGNNGEVTFRDPSTGAAYSREQVIGALQSAYGMSPQDAANYVYGNFKDNPTTHQITSGLTSALNASQQLAKNPPAQTFYPNTTIGPAN